MITNFTISEIQELQKISKIVFLIWGITFTFSYLIFLLSVNTHSKKTFSTFIEWHFFENGFFLGVYNFLMAILFGLLIILNLFSTL